MNQGSYCNLEENPSNIGGVTLGVNVHTFGLQIDEILKCKDITERTRFNFWHTFYIEYKLRHIYFVIKHT